MENLGKRSNLLRLQKTTHCKEKKFIENFFKKYLF